LRAQFNLHYSSSIKNADQGQELKNVNSDPSGKQSWVPVEKVYRLDEDMAAKSQQQACSKLSANAKCHTEERAVKAPKSHGFAYYNCTLHKIAKLEKEIPSLQNPNVQSHF